MPRRLLLLLLVVNACGGDASEDRTPRLRAPRPTCEKNIDVLVGIHTENPQPPGCSEDSTCPCGSYCDLDIGRCTNECVSDDHAFNCSEGKTCSLWGECVDPNGSGPAQAPSLRLPEGTIRLPQPGDQAQVAVRLSLPTGAATSQPSLLVRGAVHTAHCPGGGTTCPDPRLRTFQRVQVRCGDTGEFVDSCRIESWTWATEAGEQQAHASVWVRAASVASLGDSELSVEGGNGVMEGATRPVQIGVVAPVSFAGRYRGRLRLTSADGHGSVDAAVSAVAAGENMVVLDDGRALSAGGRLPLQKVTAAPVISGFPFLSVGSGNLQARWEVLSREFDEESGRLHAEVAVVLPFASRRLTGSVDLVRVAALEAPACTPACASGTVCEPIVGVCLAGPAFAGTLGSGNPQNTLSWADYQGWITATRAQLFARKLMPSAWNWLNPVTADSLERLACYADGSSEAVARGSVLGALGPDNHSGEVRCEALAGEPTSGDFGWAARLAVRGDANTADLAIGPLLAKCVADLNTPVPSGAPSFANSPCLSMSRLVAALGMSLDTGMQNGEVNRRRVTFAQSLLRHWLTVHAFVAAQGHEHTELARSIAVSPPTATSVPALLDVLARGYLAVLQSQVAGKLLGADPGDLRDPDHRVAGRPSIYWYNSNAPDLAGGLSLSQNAPGCCATPGYCNPDETCSAFSSPELDPVAWDLGNELTLNFTTHFSAHRPFHGTRRLVVSPWIDVRMTVAGAAMRARGANIFDGGGPVKSNVVDWLACRTHCTADPVCHAWRYTASSKTCELLSGIWGDEVVNDPGTYSGIISLNDHQGATPAAFVTHDVGFTRIGMDIQETANVSFAACYDLCGSNSNCKSFDYSPGQKKCWLKNGVPGKTAATGIESVVMPSVVLDVAHRTATGAVSKVRFEIPRQYALGDRLLFYHQVTLVRTSLMGSYRLYIDGNFVGAQMYSEAPGRFPGRFRFADGVGETPLPGHWKYPTWQSAFGMAVWATALDDFAIAAIAKRRASGLAEPLWASRPEFPENPDHDPPVGLPVTMLEGLVAQRGLVEQLLESMVGPNDSVCRGEAPAHLTAADFDRVATAMRQGVALRELAGALAERAARVECDSDAVCAEYDATCGPEAYLSQRGVDAALSGNMLPTPNYYELDAPIHLASQNFMGPLSTPSTSNAAVFTFDVVKPGKHRVFGRMFTGASGRFHVRVDEGAWQTWNVRASSTSPLAWQWESAPIGANGSVLLELAPGTHTVTVAAFDPYVYLDRLVLTSDSRNVVPDQRHSVCYAGGQPVHVALPWQAQLDGALALADAAEASARQKLDDLTSCRPPMDMATSDAPLYFMNTGAHPAQRFFASTMHLLGTPVLGGLARLAVSDAEADLTQASNAWIAVQNDAYQASQVDLEDRQRLIRKEYDVALARECGSENLGSTGLLARLDGDAEADLEPEMCFVKQTTACMANALRPAREASAACYGGQLGEALLAMKANAVDLEGARFEWTARQGELERESRVCVFAQQTQTMIEKHNAQMDAMRRKKAVFDTIVGIAASGAALSTGGVAAISVYQNIADIDTSLGRLERWQVRLDAAAGFLKTFASGTSVLAGLLGASGEDVEEERQKWEEVMQARSSQEHVMTCWNRVAAIRDQIGLAQNRIERATVDVELATMRFVNARREVDRLVSAGVAELRREESRHHPRPQHHYWLAEELTAYRGSFAWAKKLLYLSILALEYDSQSSTGLREDVLSARNPYDLKQVLLVLDTEGTALTGLHTCGQAPQAGTVILRASQLMPVDQSLGSFLKSDASIIRGKDGKTLGRGFAFTLMPGQAWFADTSLWGRSAERLWHVTGSVQVGSSFFTWPFEIRKRNTFYSRWCGGGPPPGIDETMQRGTRRPAASLLNGGPGSLADAAVFQPATIDNTTDLGEIDLRAATGGLVDNFAGQGVYGDYVLLFRTDGEQTRDLGKVLDVMLRFDHLSVHDGAGL